MRLDGRRLRCSKKNLNALSEPIKDALAPLESPATFNTLVSSAIRLDNRLSERERERETRRVRPLHSGSSCGLPTTAPSAGRSSLAFEKAMQVDGSLLRNASRLQPEPRLCWHCHRGGHFRRECPKWSAKGGSR